MLSICFRTIFVIVDVAGIEPAFR